MAYGNAIRSWAFRLTAKESLMIRSIISGLFLAATVTLASAAAPLELVDNPPDRHVVVKGDTLWYISSKSRQTT